MAVNNKGADSPTPRATASSTPVTNPASAAGITTRRVMAASLAPRARAPSLRSLGTVRSAVSLARTTTGSMIKAMPKLPAIAEKWCIVVTRTP